MGNTSAQVRRIASSVGTTPGTRQIGAKMYAKESFKGYCKHNIRQQKREENTYNKIDLRFQGVQSSSEVSCCRLSGPEVLPSGFRFSIAATTKAYRSGSFS